MWNPFKKVTYQSSLNGTITIGKLQGNKALFSGGVTQSGGEIKPMWDTVIKNFYAQKQKAHTILLLGLGGGSVIQAIRAYDKAAIITAVELDPVMKQIAYEQFGVEENKKQKIYIADAVTFISKETKKYDLIIVDLYNGPLNPPKTRTKKFLIQVKNVLKPEGMIFYNAHYQQKNTGEYEAFRKITDMVFKKTEEVFSYPLNRVLLLQR